MNATMVDRQVMPLPGGPVPPMREPCWNPAYGGYPSPLFPGMPESNFQVFPFMWPHGSRGPDHFHHNPSLRAFPRPGGPPKAMPRSMYQKDLHKENRSAAFAHHQHHYAKESAQKKGGDASAASKYVKDGEKVHARSHVEVKSEPKSSSGTHQQAPETNEVGGKRKPWRILLTGEQAREIYLRRPGQDKPGTSLALAAEFGVSVKTIRDIWNRETWIRSTRSLWTPEEQELHVAACQAKSDLTHAKAAASSSATAPEPLPSPTAAAAAAVGRKREMTISAGGGGKRMRGGKAEAETEGPGLHDDAADAEAVEGLLMMCSAR